MTDSLLLVALAVAVPALAVVGFLTAQARQKRLMEWARRIGWTYVGTDPSLLVRWQGTPFGQGRSRRVSELVAGRYGGRAATSFAYRYTTGNGKNQETHTFQVATLSLPAYLATVELTPDGIGAKLAKAFGGQDISFESEAFNQAWRVEARDAKFAHDVIHPRLMERLLRSDARGMSIRIEGTDILCWSPGSPDLDALAGKLGVLQAVIQSIPRYVWLAHGYDPPTPVTEPGV